MNVLLVITALTVLPPLLMADELLPCLPGTVADVLNTTCTIGDKTFSFSGYDINNFTGPAGVISGNDPLLIGFTPLVGDPNAPGFRLTGSIFAAVVTSAGTAYDPVAAGGTLSFSVATTDNTAMITGMRVSQALPLMTTNSDATCPEEVCFSIANSIAEGFMDFQGPYSYQIHYDYQQAQYSGQDPSIGVNTYDDGPQPPVASIYAHAILGPFVYNVAPEGSGESSASATFTSADFLITQNPDLTATATPEPSFSALLGVMTLGFLSVRHRRVMQRGENRLSARGRT